MESFSPGALKRHAVFNLQIRHAIGQIGVLAESKSQPYLGGERLAFLAFPKPIVREQLHAQNTPSSHHVYV